jgi:hypothetical protein
VRDYHRRQKRTVTAVGGPDADPVLAQVPAVAERSDEDEMQGAIERGKLSLQMLETIHRDFDETTWQAF